MKNRICHISGLIISLSVLMLVPSAARAQYLFDALSVEAMIDSHKQVRTWLLARSTIEEANQALHNYSKDLSVDYDSINTQLDRYTKAFDVIDAIINGGMTVGNAVRTYDVTSDRIAKIIDMINVFMDECTLKGNILSSDTLIINACRRTIDSVADDAGFLVSDLGVLAEYATGVKHASTSQFMAVLESINEHLDGIRDNVEGCYRYLWKYIMIRTHYWKKSILFARDLKEMAEDAFGRWYKVAEKVHDKLSK